MNVRLNALLFKQLKSYIVRRQTNVRRTTDERRTHIGPDRENMVRPEKIFSISITKVWEQVKGARRSRKIRWVSNGLQCFRVLWKLNFSFQCIRSAQADRQTDGRTDRRADRQTDKQADRLGTDTVTRPGNERREKIVAYYCGTLKTLRVPGIPGSRTSRGEAAQIGNLYWSQSLTAYQCAQSVEI